MDRLLDQALAILDMTGKQIDIWIARQKDIYQDRKMDRK